MVLNTLVRQKDLKKGAAGKVFLRALSRPFRRIETAQPARNLLHRATMKDTEQPTNQPFSIATMNFAPQFISRPNLASATQTSQKRVVQMIPQVPPSTAL